MGPMGPSPTTVSAAWMSMPGVKPSEGFPFFVHALIEQADADDFGERRRPACAAPSCFSLGERRWQAGRLRFSPRSFNQRFRHRRAGPDLDGAGALHLRADPLHELAHRENHAVVLVQKRRRPRQIQRVMLERQQPI